MKRSILILKSHVRAYQSMIDLYTDNPNNQVVTKYTADDAVKAIADLSAAIEVLKKAL